MSNNLNDDLSLFNELTTYFLKEEQQNPVSDYISPDKLHKALDLKLSKEFKDFSLKRKAKYIKKISKIKYDYEREKNPNISKLINDVKIAKENMSKRIKKLKIKVKSNVFINVQNKKIRVISGGKNLKLECKLDLRLLRRILDKKAHWNNAEVGSHVDFKRNPNKADIDAHVCMSFFHL